DGDDIVFTLSNGTKLSHEIEKYTSATGELYAWVKVPTLSASSDTTLYMYYGNAACSSQQDATGVWDNNYLGAWHFNDNADDSTSNSYNGTPSTGVTYVTGKIENGIRTDGSAEYINLPVIEVGSTYTLSSWSEFPLNNTGQWRTLFQRQGGTYHHTLVQSDGQIGIYNGGFYSSGYDIDNLAAGWHYITAVASSGTTKFYIDGSTLVGTSNSVVTEEVSRFGNHTTGQQWGSFDEIHISNTARGADWIATSYNNQNDPASYETVGSEAAAKALLPVANNLTQSDGTFDLTDGSLGVSGNILISGGTLDGSDTSCNLDIAGNVTLSAGILSAPAVLDDTSFIVAGNWEISGTGIFTPNAGRVVFDAFSIGKTITTSSSGADDFYDVKFNNSSGGWALQDELTVSNDIAVTGGTLDANDQTLSINGNTTINGGTLKTGTGVVTFGDAADDIVTISSGELHIESDNTATDIVKNAGTWTNSGGTISYNADTVVATNLLSSPSPYYNLTINSSDSTYTADGALTVSNDFTLTNGTISVNGQSLTVTGDYTQSNGTFTCGSGTLRVDTNFTKSGGTFNEDTGTVTFGGTTDGTFDVDTSETFNNVTINKTTDVSDILTIISGDTIVITGTLTLTDGEVTGAVNAQGNVTVGASFNQGDANITFSGTSNQTITMTGDKFPTGTLTVNKSSNTATTSGTLTLTGALI
ncbi:MAG: DUF2341 domain-containing protein, partial [Candidatus Aureabacteria bacterium]|nr:DUF2341 domain-containing protein [Candidatus Auribacterota bacterium]